MIRVSPCRCIGPLYRKGAYACTRPGSPPSAIRGSEWRGFSCFCGWWLVASRQGIQGTNLGGFWASGLSFGARLRTCWTCNWANFSKVLRRDRGRCWKVGSRTDQRWCRSSSRRRTQPVLSFWARRWSSWCCSWWPVLHCLLRWSCKSSRRSFPPRYEPVSCFRCN